MRLPCPTKALMLLLTIMPNATQAFVSVSSSHHCKSASLASRCTNASSPTRIEASASDNDEEKLITKEMFLRDMLSDPASTGSATVKRKKKNGTHFRTLDNRDSMPFLVKVQTPDPYTNNAVMKKEAKLNTLKAKKKNDDTGKDKKNKKVTRRQNLVGMDGRDSIASSIYTRSSDGSMQTVVGEFALDKSTNCGDIIEVGDGTEYQVQKARCQYKYAGGKRFVMTKKILEVKEVKRVLIEQEVKQLFEKDVNSDGDVNLNLE